MIEKDIEKYMALVRKVLRRLNIKDRELLDRMQQAGRIGIWKALSNKLHNSDSYVWQSIKWEIVNEFRFLNRFPFEPLPPSLVHSYKEKLKDYLPDNLSLQEKKILKLELEEYTILSSSKKLNVDVKTFKIIRNNLYRKIAGIYA